ASLLVRSRSLAAHPSVDRTWVANARDVRMWLVSCGLLAFARWLRIPLLAFARIGPVRDLAGETAKSNGAPDPEPDKCCLLSAIDCRQFRGLASGTCSPSSRHFSLSLCLSRRRSHLFPFCARSSTCSTCE